MSDSDSQGESGGECALKRELYVSLLARLRYVFSKFYRLHGERKRAIILPVITVGKCKIEVGRVARAGGTLMHVCVFSLYLLRLS